MPNQPKDSRRIRYRSAQGIFNAVAKHLLKQNARSVNEKGQCMYRASLQGGTNLRKCAIGCLIPDARYKESLEGLGCKSASVRSAARIPSTLSQFARQLQHIHDHYGPNSWRSLLSEFAAEHSLNADVLNPN